MVGLVGGSTVRAEHVVANAGGETEYVRRLHRHAPAEHQCTSTLVKHIKAPVHLVSSHPSPALAPRSCRLPARSVPVVGGSVVGLDAAGTGLVLGIVSPRVWAAISHGSGVPRPIPHALLGVSSPIDAFS